MTLLFPATVVDYVMCHIGNLRGSFCLLFPVHVPNRGDNDSEIRLLIVILYLRSAFVLCIIGTRIRDAFFSNVWSIGELYQTSSHVIYSSQ